MEGIVACVVKGQLEDAAEELCQAVRLGDHQRGAGYFQGVHLEDHLEAHQGVHLEDHLEVHQEVHLEVHQEVQLGEYLEVHLEDHQEVHLPGYLIGETNTV